MNMEQKTQQLLPVPNTISLFWKKGQVILESDTPGRKFCLVIITGYTYGQAFFFLARYLAQFSYQELNLGHGNESPES